MTGDDSRVTPRNIIEGKQQDVTKRLNVLDHLLRHGENLPSQGELYLKGRRDALLHIRNELDHVASYEFMGERVERSKEADDE